MQRKGFTLVELLVVVGIIGVLASVSIVSVNSVRQKGRDAKRISEVKEMQTALEAYFASNNTYPVGGTDVAPFKLGSAGKVSLCPTATGFDAACVDPATPFMKTVHADPLAGTAIAGKVAPVDKYEYYYKSAKDDGADCAAPLVTCSSYQIQFYLESGAGSYKGGTIISAKPSGIIQ